MSGGSLDYAYSKIEFIADEIEQTANRYDSNHPQLRRELAVHLLRVSKVLKALEWSDSSDTGPDDWVEPANQLLAPFRSRRSTDSAS